MTPLRLALAVAFVAVPTVALAQIPVGTRVGTTTGTPSGYDDGGRPDPFSSLVVKHTAAPVGPATAKPGAANSLATLAIADANCTGVMKTGTRYLSAIVEGPNHLSFIVKPQDRLLDGVVKSIDALGVVFVEHTTDLAGAVEGKEVRKWLHPQEVIR